MARGVSTKLKAGLPAGYRAGWLEKLDRRTRVARAIMDRIAVLASDAGGAETLSHAQQSLIKRAVFLEAIVESHELRFASGEAIDVGSYTQALNSMLGVYRVVGIARRAKPVRTLHEHLAQQAAP